MRHVEANRAGVSPKPLLEELRPDDEILVIEDWMPLGLEPPVPDGESKLSILTKGTPTVAVVKVLATAGHISANGHWIETEVTASVVAPLKNAERRDSLKPAELVRFVTPGGELAVGKQIIRAIRTKAGQFVPGAEYLVFANTLDGGALWVSPLNAARVEGDRLTAMSHDSQRLFEADDKDTVLSTVASLALVKS